MPRFARKIAPGYPHHIVQRGHNKEKIFLKDEDYQTYLGLLKNFSNKEGSEIRSFCLMPNHVHLLLVPRLESSLVKTMHRLNTTYAAYFNKKYLKTGSIWESRYYSSIVDNDSYLWTVIKYIERNPVRAGIVSHPLDYTWSSARITQKQKNNYGQFIEKCEMPGDLEIIRTGTRRCRYIGSSAFKTHLKERVGIEFAEPKRGRPFRINGANPH